MIFYHGTTQEAWKQIQKDGFLLGGRGSYRYTFLTGKREIAEKYAKSILLQVSYEPKGMGFDNCLLDLDSFLCEECLVFVPVLVKDLEVMK